MIFRFFNHSFKFSAVSCVVTLCAIAILVKLGFWQLTRAEQKQHRLNQVTERQQLQPFSLSELNHLSAKGENIQDFPLALSGRFLNQFTYLLDNKIYAGRVGYQIIRLFETKNGLKVLVNLGWIAVGQSRNDIPALHNLDGEWQIQGQVYIPPEQPFQLAPFATKEGWPKVIQQIELQHMRPQLPQNVSEFVLLLSPTNEIPYPREWQAVVMAPEKHYGYAIQWFGLAIACLSVFIFASRIKQEVSHE